MTASRDRTGELAMFSASHQQNLEGIVVRHVCASCGEHAMRPSVARQCASSAAGHCSDRRPAWCPLKTPPARWIRPVARGREVIYEPDVSDGCLRFVDRCESLPSSAADCSRRASRAFLTVASSA